jgi:hypothetical protein
LTTECDSPCLCPFPNDPGTSDGETSDQTCYAGA